MEATDIIDKMQEYDEADLWWGRKPDGTGHEWTFYALNNLGELNYEDWSGNGDNPVEAYKDAMEGGSHVSKMEV